MGDPEEAINLESTEVDPDNISDDEDEDARGKSGKAKGPDKGDPPAEEMPLEVKRRVRSLKKLQLEITKIECRFHHEMHALECKYLAQYSPYFDKRKAIVNGLYEPGDDECDYGSDDEFEENDIAKQVEGLKIGEGDAAAKEKITGIPYFWLTIFRNVEMLNELIQDNDIPILKHLVDIKVEVHDNPMGFTLHFYFNPNEYFENTVLTKRYEMKCEPDPEDPFSFEGPEIVKCTGCVIDWYKDKNVTVKTVQKKQKHKQKGQIRVVTRTVEAPSFFNFFNPPSIPEEISDSVIDAETQIHLTNDFEIGQYIRERIVPRAVLYYTGEALEEEFEGEEEDEIEEDEEFDEEDEAALNRLNAMPAAATANPGDECKTQ